MHNLPAGTVTLLFTDIEGSTHLLQQLDDRYTHVLTECRRQLRAAFQQWHGHEVDTQGDAFIVAFARATDAVSAAVAAQRTLFTHAWPEGVTVRVRIGLHTGEPRLSSEGYVGLDVHRTARLMNAGHGGQVLLSQTTRDLVEHDLPDGVMLRNIGEHRLKDVPGTTHLYQLVIADLPADFPPLKTLDPSPGNLLLQPTPFIGREKEMEAVQRLLCQDDVRLLTLTGPGGTGKTRLGLQVAAELSGDFADGIFFVSLAPIRDPDLVISTIAQALGLREAGSRSLLEQLKNFLREKQVLLLLDNFEQVVIAALQVADLLTVCPKLKVLVTSREVLHVRAEREFAVPPLTLPDPNHLPDLVALSQYEAVALFILRAQVVKPDFQVTNANAPAVAEICARLDGLPLAIELAAARIKLLPPQALLARLEHRLQILTSGTQDVPARQQTLRNTIAWSYDLLGAAEQRLFRRLSVFVGGCMLEAVESLCDALDDDDGAMPVLDAVASLIDKSLLQQTEPEGQELRLMMLETIREYGLEALAERGEMQASRAAHAAYYLALAEEAEPELQGRQQVVWLEQLEWEHDNLRMAQQWLLKQGEAGQGMEMALRLGGALLHFWEVRGPMSEGRDFLERVLAGSGGTSAAVRAKALKAAGELAFFQGDYERSAALVEESLALFRELGDTGGIIHCLYMLGSLALESGDPGRAASLFEENLALGRQVGDKVGIAWSLFRLADLASEQGEYTKARALYEESLALQRELGNTQGIANALISFAELLCLAQGDSAVVRSLLEESLALFRELGDKDGLAFILYFMGKFTLDQGDVVTAHLLLEEGVALQKEIRHLEKTAQSLSFLARAYAMQGNHATARILCEESLALAKEITDKQEVASYLEGLAGVAVVQGEFAWAARLWGAAEVLRETIGTPLPPVERAAYEHSVAVARSHLGEKIFAADWVRGRTMTPEQALAAQEPALTPEEHTARPAPIPLAKVPTYPAGLTAREVEVLRLVAQGLTDAQVAEQLIISPRTVNWHLTSIYSKIGVSSRSAATRYAIEQHFV